MRFTYLLGFCLIFTSCSLLITENEEAAINDILEVYGGKISYSIGTSTSTENTLKGKYFEMELSGSQFLNDYANELDYYIPVIGLIFYKGLNEQERENYNYYVIKVNLANGSHERKIATKELEKLLRNERNAYKSTKAFTEGNVDAICNKFKTVAVSQTICDSIFIDAVNLADSLGGAFSESFLFAYMPLISSNEDSFRIDQFIYQVNYSERNGRIHVSVPASGEDSLTGLNISYYADPDSTSELE